MQGFWSVGSHEKKKLAEDEELKVDSHDRRDRPSWFKARIVGDRHMPINKRNEVITLLDMMQIVLCYCSVSSSSKQLQQLEFHQMMSLQ